MEHLFEKETLVEEMGDCANGSCFGGCYGGCHGGCRTTCYGVSK